MVSYLLFVELFSHSSLVALLWHQPQHDLYCRHSNLYKLISIENLKTRLRATFKLCKLKQLEIYGWEKGLK